MGTALYETRTILRSYAHTTNGNSNVPYKISSSDKQTNKLTRLCTVYSGCSYRLHVAWCCFHKAQQHQKIVSKSPKITGSAQCAWKCSSRRLMNTAHHPPFSPRRLNTAGSEAAATCFAKTVQKKSRKPRASLPVPFAVHHSAAGCLSRIHSRTPKAGSRSWTTIAAETSLSKR